jgi:DNA transformation protein
MAVQPQYLAYILDQLERLGALRSRRMFGAVGLYSNELFFGLIDDDTVFLKTDARNLEDYLSRNMPRFMPDPARPAATLGYYQVPADIIEDTEALLTWARKAVEVALASHAAKARAPQPRPAAARTRPRKAGKRAAPRKNAATKKSAPARSRVRTGAAARRPKRRR